MHRYVIAAVLGGLVWMSAAPADAQDAPPLYRVVNVDAHDTLNIRATPSPTAAILGDLPPDTRSVEVLETRHGWGRILSGEGSGWISLAYLDVMDRPSVAGFDAPAGLHCAGTEPFWGVAINPDGSAVYHDMMTLGEDRTMAITDARTARGRFAPFIYHVDGELTGMALIRPAQCSDGMSDRTYGWEAVVDMRDEAGARLMEGCCWTPVGTG